NWPVDSAVPIDWVSTVPSMSGVAPVEFWWARIVDTGTLRRHSAVWLAQPTAVANASPDTSAAASDGCVRLYAPLSTIAAENKSCAAGDATCDSTLRPPADSPKIVILCAFPPNAPMFRCTQRSAAC